MASNSLSMQPPHRCRRLSPDDEIGASQPLAVMRRKVRRALEFERSRDFGRNILRERKAARRVERQKIVDGVERNETRLPRTAWRHLFLQEVAHLGRTRRDPSDILQTKLLPDFVERIG